MNRPKSIIPIELIEKRILQMRGHNVLLSIHLAELYQVENKVLMQSVRRNLKRFPKDFLFQLTHKEYKNLKSQIVTSSWGGTRKLPFAFTEHRVAMLSSVLNSDRAIQVNIEIIRTFVKLRKIFSTHKNLARKLLRLEKKYDEQFKMVFEAIHKILMPPEKPKRPIGFIVEEPNGIYSIK